MVRFLSFLRRKFKSTRTDGARLQEERLPSGNPSKPNLFSRLPFEIRHMIYVYALEPDLLYITSEGIFKSTGPCDPEITRPEFSRYHREQEPYHLPFLLQTCKQIYAEASPVLYSTSIFVIYGMNNLSSCCNLSQHIRRDCLEAITSICINSPADYYTLTGPLLSSQRHNDVFLNLWRQVWEVIATQLVGLRDLEVRLLKTYSPRLELTLQEDWVKPMLGIRGLRKFEFDLSQGIGPYESTAKYNEELDCFKEQLRNSMCSAK